ncbi:GntR family transcriptional regulator [Streptomyces sp. NPDC093094]|uniref:GntR family transcriptional regulator n=1 Tax=Streptomyces sp. NPDC093094 TaxID=3366026 RepID=UPI00380AF279
MTKVDQDHGMELSPDDPLPAYLQIAATLREDIATGKLGPGGRLPSGQEPAKEFGTALMTAQHALRVLRDEGLVISRQGSGVFVHTPAQSRQEAMRPHASEASVAARLESVQLEPSKMNERLASIEQQLRDGRGTAEEQRADAVHDRLQGAATKGAGMVVRSRGEGPVVGSGPMRARSSLLRLVARLGVLRR